MLIFPLYHSILPVLQSLYLFLVFFLLEYLYTYLLIFSHHFLTSYHIDFFHKVVLLLMQLLFRLPALVIFRFSHKIILLFDKLLIFLLSHIHSFSLVLQSIYIPQVLFLLEPLNIYPPTVSHHIYAIWHIDCCHKFVLL